MTWTKLSDDFSDECHTLSDAGFRTHVEALIWTMRRETDGYITSHDVRRFAESPHAQMAIEELVACGWWEIDGQGYRIRHHMEHQPEPDLIARRREQSAQRQKKFRRRKAGLESSGPLDASPRPVPTRPVPGNASSNGVTDAWDDITVQEIPS